MPMDKQLRRQSGFNAFLTGIRVQEVMRKNVVRLPLEATVEDALRRLIKFRVNGLLVEHDNALPAGVLSKTDIMGAYYASLPISIQAQDIMSRPVMTCRPDDSLEDALGQMKVAGVTRLFVRPGDGGEVMGVLAYPDVVGLMYRHCHYCPKSLFRGQYISGESEKAILRFSVCDVMSMAVAQVGSTATIEQVMEELSQAHTGALLIRSQEGVVEGVVSVNDLVLSYKRGWRPDKPAREIMASPVKVCAGDAMLEQAIQTMIFSDISRLFVHGESTDDIIGVLSLADAAKARAGSCQACIVSRISVKD